MKNVKCRNCDSYRNEWCKEVTDSPDPDIDRDCAHFRELAKDSELKPCPFCGGEIDEHGVLCNYGKKIMTLDLKCRKCGTLFKFKSKWQDNPYSEAIAAWNRRAGEKEADHA